MGLLSQTSPQSPPIFTFPEVLFVVLHPEFWGFGNPAPNYSTTLIILHPGSSCNRVEKRRKKRKKKTYTTHQNLQCSPHCLGTRAPPNRAENLLVFSLCRLPFLAQLMLAQDRLGAGLWESGANKERRKMGISALSLSAGSSSPTLSARMRALSLSLCLCHFQVSDNIEIGLRERRKSWEPHCQFSGTMNSCLLPQSACCYLYFKVLK